MMSLDGCSWFFSKMRSLDDIWRNDINTASRIDTGINCSVLDLSWQNNDWENWKTAQPIEFYSRQYRPTKMNYPTHKQEMLAIVECMKHW